MLGYGEPSNRTLAHAGDAADRRLRVGRATRARSQGAKRFPFHSWVTMRVGTAREAEDAQMIVRQCPRKLALPRFRPRHSLEWLDEYSAMSRILNLRRFRGRHRTEKPEKLGSVHRFARFGRSGLGE